MFSATRTSLSLTMITSPNPGSFPYFAHQFVRERLRLWRAWRDRYQVRSVLVRHDWTVIRCGPIGIPLLHWKNQETPPRAPEH
jgi:hypothetical protein